MVEKPVSLTIKSKIILVSLFLSLTTLFTVSMLSFITSDNLLKERVEAQLASESTGRAAAIRSLIDSRVQQVGVFAANDVVQGVASKISAAADSAGGGDDGSGRLPDELAQEVEEYRREFNSELESLRHVAGNSIQLEDVVLIGRDGRVLLSSNAAMESTGYLGGERFMQALDGAGFLDFELINGSRKAVVAVPITGRSDSGPSLSLSSSSSSLSSPSSPTLPAEPVVGVMVATMGTGAFDEILLNRRGLGETGEVYLVNMDKLLISESRFIENAAFRQTVDTLAVRECLENNVGISDVYPDYRNIPVVGFSYCAQDKGFVLLAEFDEAEVFSPVTQLRDAILAAAVVITGVVVVSALYVSKTISNPLTKLRDAADRISKGDYDYKVEIDSRDEVGQLAVQFDNMRKSVLETNMNLSRIVKERTKELGDMTNALDATAIVAVTDKDGTITKVNRKFVEISKFSEDELIGQNHRLLKSGQHPPEYFEHMWKTISSGRIFEGEIKNKAKDGSYYWVKTTIVPFLDENGRPKQYIAIHNDVTDLKNIEEQLQQALERERKNTEIIMQQAEALRQTNLELQKKDKLKDEFLSMASHELKTPLTPIIGWCGALKSNRILGSITPEQRGAVETIEKNAVKLEKMISDMLDVQKLELNEIHFDMGDTDVDRVFRNIEKDFQFMMKEKNIQFTIKAEPGLKLVSDESRITQVLSALLYNSVDFVPKAGGRIEVGAEKATAREGARTGDIIFYVKDNGPGIPKDKQQFLFQKFYQVDTSLTRKHGGTGLGLAISKGIVTGLGGNIWVETEEGKGSSFYFSLPGERREKDNR